MPIKLEQYFDSEERWLEFSELFKEFWNDSDSQIDLLELCNKQKDIAMVIYYHTGNNYKKWLNSKVPALDNLMPIECFNDEILIKRLKVCLRRMP